MNAESLLRRFDLIVDVPGNVPLIRRLVVDLAIRGKLIEPQQSDATPRDILKQLAARRLTLLSAEETNKRSAWPPVGADELPAEYGHDCTFVRLSQVAVLKKGLTGIQTAAPGQYPMVVTAEARSSCDHFDFDGAAVIIPLVSSTGHGSASLKRLHYQEGKFALGNILCAAFSIAEDLVSARFLYEYLFAYRDELLVSRMTGTANVSLNISKIGEVPVPIVSPKTQRRVNEIMTICDRLEGTQAEAEGRRTQLVGASMHRLHASEDRDSLRKESRFCIENLRHLTKRPEHISQLRECICNLAVRGQLSRQYPTDESVGTLIKRIVTEKERFLNARSRARKAEAPSEGLGFAVPAAWRAVDVGDICNVVTSGSRGWAEYYSDVGAKFIRAQNVRYGRLLLHDIARVNLPKNAEGTRTSVSPGDLLVVITGAGVTNPAMLTVDIGEAYVSQHIALLKVTLKEVSPWILLCLMAPANARAQLLERAYGSGKPGLNLDNIRRLRIPFPPLAEQQRIIALIDKAFAVCDRLEDQLQVVNDGGARLLESFVFKPEAIKARHLKDKDTILSKHLARHDDKLGAGGVGVTSGGSRRLAFSTSNPVSSVSQLVECVASLGDAATAANLLAASGLGEDVERFFDLMREGRASRVLDVPMGENRPIRRIDNAP